ncbi:hypothetical protein C0V77_22745, partial [Emticicia sp. TH156]
APNLPLFEYQIKVKESTFNLRRISFGARTYNASIGRFDGVDLLGEIFPTISPYGYTINNPVLFNDRLGLYPESSQPIAICPTCPSDPKFDEYRNSDALFTYDKSTGIVVNGNGQEPTVHGKRTQPIEAPTIGWPWQADLAIGASEWHLGNRIVKVAKWDGTYRYPGSKLSQKEINAKAIARQPLIKNRPINIIRNVALPRNLALKIAAGLKVVGGITTLIGIADVSSKRVFGNITTTHALTTLAVTGISLATGGIGGIAIATIYAIYEDDLWHDYDKENATNFVEKKE